MFMSGLFPQPPEFIEMKEKPSRKISEQNTIVFEILPALSVLRGSPVKAVTVVHRWWSTPGTSPRLLRFPAIRWEMSAHTRGYYPMPKVPVLHLGGALHRITGRG